MRINKVLAEGSRRGVISPDQEARLAAIAKEMAVDLPVLSIENAFYYLGGFAAISGITLYVTTGFERFTGLELAFIASAVMLASLFGSYTLLKKGTMIPAGILGALAVVATPLLVYGIQKHLGYWPTFGGRGEVGGYRSYHTLVGDQWLVMEIATLAVACAVLAVVRMPFLVMPVAVTLWYMCMDMADRVVNGQSGGMHVSYYETYRTMSIWFGLVVLAIGFMVDLVAHKKERGFAFWLYLSGMATFWGAVTSMDSTNELSKLMYCLMNVGFVLLAGVIRQWVFSVFGYAGIAMYMYHISTTLFKDEAMFPIACVFTGVLVMGAGFLWRKMGPQVIDSLRRSLAFDRPAGQVPAE